MNGIELSDNELEMVVGGSTTSKAELIRVSCRKCGNVFMVVGNKDGVTCPECGNEISNKKHSMN